MNSSRDPMLATGSEGMMLFDNTADDTMQDSEAFYGNGFPDQNDLMGEMFATSPQQSTISLSSLKEQTVRQPQNTMMQPGSSPEYSSEESSSDDSGRHKRKSSSMSYHTDVEMPDGHKPAKYQNSLQQPAVSGNMLAGPPTSNIDSHMLDEAMANDFDFDSAASSPSPNKSPNGSSEAVSYPIQTYSGNQVYHSHANSQVGRIKTESIASASPTMSARKSPSVQREGSTFSSRSTKSSRPAQARTQVYIHPIPAKSRVETQIPMKVTIYPLPDGVDKLHLPTHTISKPKLIVRPTPEPSPDTLELHSMLVCTSAMQDPVKRERAFERAAAKTREMEAKEKDTLPHEDTFSTEHPDHPLNGGEVHICKGCITRERKRAARKKSKKPDEEAAWASDEARRVVVFNTNEIRPWEDPDTETEPVVRGRPPIRCPPGSKQLKMPMRIACYCRHHQEKLGFQVILTIKDHRGQVVGQQISDPIIITDDHKAQPPTANPISAGIGADGQGQWFDGAGLSMQHPSDLQASGQLSRNAFSSNDLTSLSMMQAPSSLNPSGFSPFASAQAPQYDSTRGPRVDKSRQASPSTTDGPMLKRRKANGPGPRLPESLVMTKAQNSNYSPSASHMPAASSTGAPSAPVSAVSPFGFTFPPSASQMGAVQQARTPSFPSGPPTPDSSSNDFWANNARTQSFDTTAPPSQAMFSAPSSRLQSRAPSPSGQVGPNVQSMPQRSSQAYGIAGPQPQITQRAPVINKIVPGEGPIAGGVEVTCLGSGFYNGIEVVFGNSPATTTTFWGETTLVCLLPPADRPGLVPVTFKHPHEHVHSVRMPSKQNFVYVDDEEPELFRHAFAILSAKMAGGQASDPADFARKTVNAHDPSMSFFGATNSGNNSRYRQMSALAAGAVVENTEATVMRCLDMIDMDESPYPADLDLPRVNGQTLLHLAASLGYQRLVAALIARGVDVDLADKNGCTALHMASLRNNAQIVRRLILAKASISVRSRLGFTAADMTRDHFILQMLDTRLHLRARSFGASSVHSRGSSLRSFALATPPRSRAVSLSRFSTGDDWDSSSDEELDESDVLTLVKTRSWHQSRRNSTVLPDVALGPSAVPEISEALTPAAAMVAWRDQLATQIQHFQQTVEGMLPHLQMPTLPNIAPLAGMPTYQAPAMVRRISSIIPGTSSRPDSPGESTGSVKENDQRWWGIFGASQPTPSEPPAYSEIFPEETNEGLDRKAQAIAATHARNAKQEESTSLASPSRTTASALSKTEAGLDQQELREEHARTVKHLRSDRNLFFIWIPLLLLLIMMAFREQFSTLLSISWNAYSNNFGNAQEARVIEV